MHCVKNVRIRGFSSLYFLAFGLNMDVSSADLRIQSECGKIWTRKTRNGNPFLRSDDNHVISVHGTIDILNEKTIRQKNIWNIQVQKLLIQN